MDMRVKLSVDFPVDAPDYAHLHGDFEGATLRGRRVMVRRDLHSGEFELFIAPAGVMTAGFVVAIEEKEQS